MGKITLRHRCTESIEQRLIRVAVLLSTILTIAKLAVIGLQSLIDAIVRR